MERALLLTASPRGEDSHSVALAEAFLETYATTRDGLEIDRLDAFALAPFGPRHAAAKMAVISGQPVPPEAAGAWEEVRATADRLLAADLLVVAAPMWNGGVPWALKLFVDTVTQPGITFAFDPETGYRGLLVGRRAVLALTSRIYAPGVAPAFGVDHQASYLRWWLAFSGIEDVREVRLQPTFPGPGFDARRAAALDAARALAHELAPEVAR